MHAVMIVAIVFAGIVLSIAAIGGTILMAIRMRHGGMSRKGLQSEAEEIRVMQEVYHGLSRLEERVEALETILMDQPSDKECQE